MKKAWYFLLAIPFYLLSILPFPLLYLFSDLLYLLGYKLLSYRKAVVMQNLRNSFPEKDDVELERIARGFYRFLFDIILETFKMLSMSERTLKQRMVFPDLSIVKKLHEQKQPIIIVMGHFGNWEWSGPGYHVQGVYPADALYHPLSNEFFEWLMYKLRTRHGLGLIPMNNIIRDMVQRRKELRSVAFIADQTPAPGQGYRVRFLNQETAVLQGPEKIAKQFKMPVVYAGVHRVKRGFYEVKFSLVTDDPSSTIEGEITRIHARLLEEDIMQQPATWLWSHRRWKHKLD